MNRTGLSELRPGEEIVVLCMVHQKQKEQKREALKEVIRTVMRYHTENIMLSTLSMREDEIVSRSAELRLTTAVFTNKEDVIQLLKEIKSKSYGISVVLSALFKDVREICQSVGLREHTYNISLGIFGKTDLLSDEKTLEITTQCGHGMISPYLVKEIVKKIKKHKMTPDEGAAIVAKPCVCGIVNPKRTERILIEMAMADSGKTSNRV
jgi:hypothetical protein